MQIEKFSLGIGDRFGREGLAQLRAVQQAEKAGVVVVPVWNKSFREHSLIGTTPDDVRAEADEAVRRGGWKHPYHVDADHIGVKTVDGFLAASDFYTLDVADFIGQPPDETALAAFVRDMAPFRGTLRIPGVDASFEVTDAVLEKIGRSYLAAVLEAGKILSPRAGRQGRRKLHRRGLHRRGDRAAAAVRAVLHPGGAGAREDPRPDDRAQVLGQVPEGDRLRRRHAGLRPRDRRRSGGRQARHLGVRPASVAEDQRPHRQRQVLALPDHQPGPGQARRRPAPQDGRDQLAGGGDRRGALRPRAGWRSPRRSISPRCRASTSSASRTRPSWRSIGPSCRPRRRSTAGPPTISSPASATTSRTPPTTSTCASSCTSLSGWPPRWAPSGPAPSRLPARWPDAA